MNFTNWVNATYQGCNDPRENTTEQECCKECGNELEMYDGDMLCYSCVVCDCCKDYKEGCDCSKKSECCGAKIIEGTDLCSDCKEHTGIEIK
tara:strand:- start:768 stop:1043 length:276 start_codon:yes stop_codon:yes gene_type:complete